jgi:hypothetical protein
MIMRSYVPLTALVASVALLSFKLWAAAPHSCAGSGTRTLTIIYNAAGIHVSPPEKTVQAGNILRFNLFGTSGKLVSVSGKSSGASWISGSGSNLKFYVCVPGDQPDGDYNYRVEAEGSPPLDPVITIHNF